MYGSKKIINTTAMVVIGIIGLLFVYRFAVIYNFYPEILSISYLILFPVFFITLGRFELKIPVTKLKKIIAPVFILSSLAVLGYLVFMPRIGEIGRVPAIIDWLDLYFADEFPYNSGYTPSSFPALFFMAMPFYFINFVSVFEFAGFALFLFLLYRTSTSSNELLHRSILLLATPVLIYGFVVRCELFFNVTLILFLIYLAEKYLDVRKINLSFFLIAAGFGIGLSTRSVVAVIYAVYLLYKFRNHLLNMILFGVVMAIVFLAFLVPFIMWDYNDFMNNGPFAIQSYLSNLPFVVSLVFVISAALAGWMVTNTEEVFFTSGMILFLMIMISYVSKIFEFGFDIAFFGDKIDLSYLAFVIPLMVLSVKDYKVGRFTGRVYNP